MAKDKKFTKICFANNVRVTSDGVVKLSVVVQESPNEKKLSDLNFFLLNSPGIEKIVNSLDFYCQNHLLFADRCMYVYI